MAGHQVWGGDFSLKPFPLFKYVFLYTYILHVIIKAFDGMFLTFTGLFKILGDQPSFLVER